VHKSSSVPPLVYWAYRKDREESIEYKRSVERMEQEELRTLGENGARDARMARSREGSRERSRERLREMDNARNVGDDAALKMSLAIGGIDGGFKERAREVNQGYNEVGSNDNAGSNTSNAGSNSSASRNRSASPVGSSSIEATETSILRAADRTNAENTNNNNTPNDSDHTDSSNSSKGILKRKSSFGEISGSFNVNGIGILGRKKEEKNGKGNGNNGNGIPKSLTNVLDNFNDNDSFTNFTALQTATRFNATNLGAPDGNGLVNAEVNGNGNGNGNGNENDTNVATVADSGTQTEKQNQKERTPPEVVEPWTPSDPTDVEFGNNSKLRFSSEVEERQIPMATALGVDTRTFQ
jgi:hypothetical protein